MYNSSPFKTELRKTVLYADNVLIYLHDRSN